METGGKYCGILQLSAEFIRAELTPTITSKGPIASKDYLRNIDRSSNQFNDFVKSPDDAIYDKNATRIHGLHKQHPSIVEAQDIASVWGSFVQ